MLSPLPESDTDPIAQRVWQMVAAIPPGKVSTYGRVAAHAGLPQSARRVGRILSRLPSDTSLPWHRVINAHGRISLPPDSDGYRLQVERLRDEGVTILAGRIDLRRFLFG